jgi:uncharacterized membrane protein YczE
MLLACLLMGLGVALEVTANVVTDAAASLTKTIADQYHFDFGRTKICFDSFLVLAGAIVSLIGLHTVAGIREGTLVAAILTGLVAGFLKKRFVFMQRFLSGKSVDKRMSA